MSCADWYRWFGEHDARGRSPSYARLAVAVADDAELCGRIDALPPAKQQPNLLFAANRYLGGPVDSWAGFRTFVTEQWSAVSAIMSERSTQTNEPGRCASLLPVLAQLPQPLALIELGASAGLCLYPDRYTYRYGDQLVGDGNVAIDVSCHGPVPIPVERPEVVGRLGIDLEPRDVTDPDDLAWLRACIWPEQVHRQQRFEHAVTLAAAEPPRLVTGDLVSALPDLLDAAPDAATVVVFHSTVFMYLDLDQRTQTGQALIDRPGVVWLSNEGPGLVPGLAADARPPSDHDQESYLEVGVGGREVVALTGPHGSWLSWTSAGWSAAAR